MNAGMAAMFRKRKASPFFCSCCKQGFCHQSRYARHLKTEGHKRFASVYDFSLGSDYREDQDAFSPIEDQNIPIEHQDEVPPIEDQNVAMEHLDAVSPAHLGEVYNDKQVCG